MYKPGSFSHPDPSVEDRPPYTHFANATHVSVYPHGVPTEWVIGVTRPSKLLLDTQVATANDYLILPKDFVAMAATPEALEKAWEPWATFVTFTDPPVNWKPWGFVWAGVTIVGSDNLCFRNGDPLPGENCDPLAGDDLINRGIINSEDRSIEEKMLASLRFF